MRLYTWQKGKALPMTASMDPQSVFCTVCLKHVAKVDALADEAPGHTAYFCSAACYGRWRAAHRPPPPPHEVHEGAGRAIWRDERLKRAARQHPQRDEPRIEGVEPGDLPPA